MMKKRRTQVLDKKSVDFMVLCFSCHDDSMLNSLGKHNQVHRWLVQAADDLPAIDISVTVDQSITGSPQVAITCDQDKLFPMSAGNAKTQKLRENFMHKWPFRGQAKGINEKNFYEIRPPAAGVDMWFAGTITKQRDDGAFEALVEMPNGTGGINFVSFNYVTKSDIREAGSKQQIELPESFILLEVPQEDPLHSTLTINGTELVTHYFARPTPAPKSDHIRKKILCKVDKDRKKVQADVGSSVFSRYLCMEPRSVSHEATKLKHTWVIQIGPWAQHTIEVEKRQKKSKIITVTIDGDVLLEATGDDIECAGENFECKFQFRGNRVVDFEVFETNKDGAALQTQAIVSQKTKYTVEATLSLSDEMNLSTADLWLNKIHFRDLAPVTDEHAEDNMHVQVQVLQLTYGMQVPYKVNYDAPSGLQEHAFMFADFLESIFGPGMLSGCCRGDPCVRQTQEWSRDIVDPPKTEEMPK